MKLNNYTQKSDRLLDRVFHKSGRLISTSLLIGGFVFLVACGEESKNEESAATLGGSGAIGASGSGGSVGVSGSEGNTGGTSGADITPTGGTDTTPTGGTDTIPTGGTGGPVAGSGPEPLDGGVGDGNVPAQDSGPGPEEDSAVQQTDSATTPGSCCPDGNCLCREPVPTSLTSDDGPFTYESYDLTGVGCVFYPTNAEPPFAAVTVSDGFGGSGGCGFSQTGQWGPFLASWGIVTMIVNTTAMDQPAQRGAKLLGGVEAFKEENNNPSSPLSGLLAGRYATSGFSMGGGGTTIAASQDSTLLSSVGIMAWTPTGNGVAVPTLFICGSSDGLAGCGTHGGPAYRAMPESTPKMMVTVNSGHAGQPSNGGGWSGAWGLAFHKLFLEGDERWRPVLLSGDYDETNIQ